MPSDAVKKLSELLTSPEQLDRVDSLLKNIEEKQRNTEVQLLASLQGQLETAREGIKQLDNSRTNISKVHDSFQEVGSLCNQSKDQLPEYSIIKRLTVVRENLRACTERSVHLSEVCIFNLLKEI